MKPAFAEPYENDQTCEIRVGQSSWDDNCHSVKFTWFDRNGKACRGGEVPVEAIPQMLSFTIRKGFLNITNV